MLRHRSTYRVVRTTMEQPPELREELHLEMLPILHPEGPHRTPHEHVYSLGCRSESRGYEASLRLEVPGPLALRLVLTVLTVSVQHTKSWHQGMPRAGRIRS